MGSGERGSAGRRWGGADWRLRVGAAPLRRRSYPRRSSLRRGQLGGRPASAAGAANGPSHEGEIVGVTDRRAQVAAQATAVADAWSAPGSPPSWWLTAALLRGIARDDVLLGIAADLPPDRQPALLLSAAVRRLAEERGGALAAYFPVPGGEQPQPQGFDDALAAFARTERAALAELCAAHRYQMTEVARSLDVLPALATIDDPRPLALVDLGTGAGLGLHLDRYAYRYAPESGAPVRVGDGPLELSCQLRGPTPAVRMPEIAVRVGIDVEPHDLADPAVRAWLAACVPPEVGAVTRFAAAVELALTDPVPVRQGDLVDVLGTVVRDLPADTLVCLVDTYVHVFLGPERLAAFDAALLALGRDVEWISVDPLVPLGPAAEATVQGLPVPERWLADNREGGVFGVIGRVSVRDGVRSGRMLGRAHPGAAWLEWLPG